MERIKTIAHNFKSWFSQKLREFSCPRHMPSFGMHRKPYCQLCGKRMNVTLGEYLRGEID